MSAHAVRLSRLFTPEYLKRINAQIVHPRPSAIVNPDELESTLGRLLTLSFEDPNKGVAHYAATLSFGIIRGKVFLNGNQATAFFVANEYIRATGVPGLADGGKVGVAYERVAGFAQRRMDDILEGLDIDTVAGKRDSD
ncbi:hypothetical protein NMY22_g3963 [Coprinellus aureogranulatus]|nr:hypothetical protein NMY22_g3963 [Coprinellus aureogranulatus]